MTALSKPSLGVCVVTGGAGAIGAQLARRLLAEGAKVVHVVDDLSSGYSWLLPKDQRLNFVQADIVDFFEGGFSAPGATVFHLAAFFANQNSVDHPIDDLATNGLGTLKVLNWASINDVRRVVYASAGCSIAGHDIDGPIMEDMPVSLTLDTPYQITKALGEFYCNYYLNLVSTVRCRFFNSYGPGEVPGRYRNVIPNFVWKALHDKPLTITGTGEETRDFIYSEDLIEGLIRCACVEEAHGEAINLGTGRQTRILDLAESIIDLTGSKSEIQYGPRRTWDRSTTRQASIEKSEKILGLEAGTEIRDGLKKTIEWFRDNFDSIEKSFES